MLCPTQLISDWLLKAPDLNPVIQVNSKRLISSSLGDRKKRLCVAVALENIHVPTFFFFLLMLPLCHKDYIEPDFYFFLLFLTNMGVAYSCKICCHVSSWLLVCFLVVDRAFCMIARRFSGGC